MGSLDLLADVFRGSPTLEKSIAKAIGDKDSRRIFHFNEIRQHFLSPEISPQRQAEMMRKELSIALKTPKTTLHLVNLILMLFTHCQPGFSDALLEKKSMEELIAYFVLLKPRFNTVKKLAWFIKLLISSSEDLREAPVYNEDLNKIGVDAFSRDSWVPEMTIEDYYELEDLIVRKHGDLNRVASAINSINKSDDVKAIQEQRGIVKEMQARLMRDELFLQEVRNSFCVSEWPQTQLSRRLSDIGNALVTIDSLLGPELYEQKKRRIFEEYKRDIEEIISVIDSTDDVEVLKQQQVLMKDLRQRLTKDAEALERIRKQYYPNSAIEEPLALFLTRTDSTLNTIENLLKTFEESNQQRKPLLLSNPSTTQQQQVSISGLEISLFALIINSWAPPNLI
ncbi:unnamed protein product [Hydatigera taeniaeformis]|uniref:Uncharacterized protein n=1 Tax=Hydatigena taeniaeformis TaxID=6205 RepID=A0A158RE45_HYDTA|nr:unnamed protein product [Hydatigera taeniaeformis]